MNPVSGVLITAVVFAAASVGVPEASAGFPGFSGYYKKKAAEAKPAQPSRKGSAKPHRKGGRGATPSPASTAGGGGGSGVSSGGVIMVGGGFDLPSGWFGSFAGTLNVSTGASIPSVPVNLGGLVINAGATFVGSGSVGLVTSSGTLAPGLSPGTLGTLNVDGAVSLLGGSTLDFDLSGAQADRLVTSGQITLGGGTLNLHAAGSVLGDSTFTLVENNGLGPVIGSFAGLSEGAAITLGGQTWTLSYVGNDGNDITLTRAVTSSGVTFDSGFDIFAPVPEPTALASLVAATGLCLRRRRRA